MAITSNNSFWCRSDVTAIRGGLGKAVTEGGACGPAAAARDAGLGDIRQASSSPRRITHLATLVMLALVAVPALAAPKLFESAQLTPSGEYTFGIEGPAVDRDGNARGLQITGCERHGHGLDMIGEAALGKAGGRRQHQHRPKPHGLEKRMLNQCRRANAYRNQQRKHGSAHDPLAAR